MRVLVTGGLGFIGSNLVQRLVKEGREVIVVDNCSDKESVKRQENIKKLGVGVIKKDLREKIQLNDIDYVYHLAAQTSVGKSFSAPDEDCSTNILGTLNALEIARSNNCPLVFSSSSTVYGKARTPTPETAELRPVSFYGLSKLCGEKYCNFYSDTYNLPVTVFRIFNAYGHGATKGVIPDLIRKIKENPKLLEILGSGRQSKDFVHVDDIVEAFMLAKPGTYNLGTGVSHTVLDIAKIIADLMGVSPKIKTGGANWPGDVPVTQADITFIKKELGWKPRIGLENGIKMMIGGRV